MFNEGNQIHNFMSSSGSGTVINYGSGSDFLTSYGSGSTSQKVTVPMVLVPQHCITFFPRITAIAPWGLCRSQFQQMNPCAVRHLGHLPACRLSLFWAHCRAQFAAPKSMRCQVEFKIFWLDQGMLQDAQFQADEHARHQVTRPFPNVGYRYSLPAAAESVKHMNSI
jgi:hypothetical protein